MKNLFVAMLLTTPLFASAADNFKSYTANNNVGCLDLPIQKTRVDLMEAIATTKSPEVKEQATKSMVEISNKKGVCNADLSGTFPILKESKGYALVITPVGQRWVIK